MSEQQLRYGSRVMRWHGPKLADLSEADRAAIIARSRRQALIHRVKLVAWIAAGPAWLVAVVAALVLLP